MPQIKQILEKVVYMPPPQKTTVTEYGSPDSSRAKKSDVVEISPKTTKDKQ